MIAGSAAGNGTAAACAPATAGGVQGADDRVTFYLIFLLLALSVVGFYDSFATAFRYRMTSYVRQEFGVELGVMAGLFTWVYLGSCFAFIPRVLADVFGRKTILWLSLVGMCALHWMIGYSRSPVEYTVFLTATSLFYRADLWLLVMSEEAPPRYRGTAMALMVAIAGLGTLALGELVKRMGPGADSWREVARFPIYGCLLSLPILFFMRETRHFQNVRAGNRRIVEWRLLWLPFATRFRRSLLVVSFLKMVLAGGILVVISVVETDFLRVDNGFGTEIVGWLIQGDVLAITAGWIVAGLLADLIGRRPATYILSAVYTASLALFALLPKGSTGVILFSVVHNFASSGIYAILRVASMEFFPNDCRATAVAWTDLFAALFAAFSTWFLSQLLGWGLSLTAVIIFCALVIPFVIPLYQFLPETKGLRLEQV